MLTLLVRWGLTSVGDLGRRNPLQLRAAWGSVTGARLWYALHGYAVAPPRTQRRQVLKIECEQTARQIPRMQHGQAIRLVEVRGDLGEPEVRGVVGARIEIGLLGDQRDPRAPSAGVRDGHARRDPGALGHRVGGNHAAVDGSRERNDPQGPAL